MKRDDGKWEGKLPILGNWNPQGSDGRRGHESTEHFTDAVALF